MSTITSEQSRNFDLLANDKRQLRRRENEQLLVYLFVVAALLTSWLLGVYQFSLFWIFVVMFVTFVVWKSKVLSLTEHFLQHCELLLHRRRALSQHETAEWLSFVIDRWYVEYTIHVNIIIGSWPSDHYFRSVCLFVHSFSQPSLIRFRSNLDICYMSRFSCVP